MSRVTDFLEMAYKRELELEDKLEDTYRRNLWFIEDTKETNIQIQIACLKYLERQRRLDELKASYH